MQLPSEPATAQQLSYLEQHGYSPPVGLTRGEAAEIIKKLRETGMAGTNPHHASADYAASDQPYHLGLALELAGGGRMDSSNPVYSMRREFWLDTCREATQMHIGSPEICTLYQLHGCRFSLPTTEEVQEVLDALDAAMPNWETTHPELFYSTLELNFRELLKRIA